MSHGERCLLVHGHFYQPPRENPWTGVIDPQPSAFPWENWNGRIADECYLPMARSRLRGGDGAVLDLYNNYAHISFNFGPTLNAWAERTRPVLLRHLKDAVDIDPTCAMAQAYNHMMLPLADARDRHTQIIWGLKEFQYRYGYRARGMWLPECGINADTVRALIDHDVRYIVLSPHQASFVRPFGQPEWQDVSMGAIDTRRCYRLFETDGGGRTHFNRYLDVLFYTPGLNLKVSFDHILNRPEDLAEELERCFGSPGDEAQLVSIVTDGEIYGHHEKAGEEALTRLISEIAPSVGATVCSAGDFVNRHPPGWEVRLWQGDEGLGSSWSCQHGMGRWYRDCGCSPARSAVWIQNWRGPLRAAFDMLRSTVRQTAGRALHQYFWDVDDARNGYITVVLDPSPANRAAFLRRQTRSRLSVEEQAVVWTLLEATHQAMLMYTSCGWFFDESSGLEPVQNMRYALRAAELIAPFCEGDPVEEFKTCLRGVPSNLERFGDGKGIFRQLVAATHYSNREIAAGLAICLAADLPTEFTSWRLVDQTPISRRQVGEASAAWGSFVCYDNRLDRYIKATWLARLDDADNNGVIFHDYQEVQADAYRDMELCPLLVDTDFSWLDKVEARQGRLGFTEAKQVLDERGVSHDRLPASVRTMLYNRFSSAKEEVILAEIAQLGTRTVPFLTQSRRHAAFIHDPIVSMVTCAYESDMAGVIHDAIASMEFSPKTATILNKSKLAAERLALHPSIAEIEYALVHTADEFLFWLSRLPDMAWLDFICSSSPAFHSGWIRPQSPSNRHLAHPRLGRFAMVLGTGLYALCSRIRSGAETPMAVIPLPELLEFAGEAGINPASHTMLGISFWDVAEKPLALHLMQDPDAGRQVVDRIGRVGLALGFDPRAVEEKIIVAERLAGL